MLHLQILHEGKKISLLQLTTYRDGFVVVEPVDFGFRFSNNHHFIYHLVSCCGSGIIYPTKW